MSSELVDQMKRDNIINPNQKVENKITYVHMPRFLFIQIITGMDNPDVNAG